MNKTKMVFMQETPAFVFITASLFAFFVVIAGIAMICCGDMIGFYYIGLIFAGLATIAYAVKTGMKHCDKPFGQMMKENRDYWKTHDK